MTSMRRFLLTAAAVVSFAAGIAAGGHTLTAADSTGGEIPGAAFTPDAATTDKDVPAPVVENKDAIELLIHDYIMANPEVILKSVEEYNNSQRDQDQQRSETAVKDNYAWLYENPGHPEAGNKKGDITIVEFFDYNCGYCKRALADVMTILGEDTNVRVVFVDLPILGPASTEASKWALAAAKQNLYLEYHVALMEHRGRYDEGQLADIATKAGLDVEKLKADKESPEVMKQLDENIAMARTLGITGTPAFTIGQDLARGYVGLDALRVGIKTNREKNAKQ